MKFTRDFLLNEARSWIMGHHIEVNDVLRLFDLHESALVTIERQGKRELQLLERNRELNDENARIRAELASLRPPEAKFEVGQIVVRVENGNAFTIRSRRLDPKGGWLWQYTNSRDPYHLSAWYAEKELRALTPEEIG